jgi:hypothetical protein
MASEALWVQGRVSSAAVLGCGFAERPARLPAAARRRPDLAGGRTFLVQYKDNLSDSEWIDLPANLSVIGSCGVALDSTTTSTNQRFYRLLTIP